MPGIEVGQIYGYRVERAALERELRFNPRKVLLDPYGRAIARPANYSRAAATKPGDNFATALKSVVTDISRSDWEGDEPLRRPFSQREPEQGINFVTCHDGFTLNDLLSYNLKHRPT